MTVRRQPPRAHRASLGSELRRLRLLSGLSGRALADRIGVSQSKISRIESGGTAPSIPEVRAWAIAADSPHDDLARLEWLAEQALNEIIPFRLWRAETDLSDVQGEIGSLEQTARAIGNFQPCFIPGLLQSSEYARRILETTGPGSRSLEAAAAARLDRQAILHDRQRRFEFILTDAALRWHRGPTDMLAPQLDRIADVATLTNVTVGVIPVDAPMHVAPVCGFVLYEERDQGEPSLVAVETPHARLEITDADDVQAYRDELALLRRSALFGAAAITYVRDLRVRS